MCNKLTVHIVFIVFLCLTASVTRADLFAYWPLDEGTGEIAFDAVGDNDAQITGGTWVTPGYAGAAAYEGSGGDEINCGPAAAPLTEDLTLAWWMIDNHPEYGTIMDKSVTGSGYGYNILVRGPGEDSPLRFRIGGWQDYGGWGTECRLPQGAYADGQWVHIVCTYDSATDTASIYVNAELMENGDLNPKTGIAGPGGYCNGLNNLEADLFIRGGEESFNGVMDEVAIWDQALTPDEVVAVYTLGPKALDPKNANSPTPEDTAADVPRDLVLSWTPGIYAATHDVYLGTSIEDVNGQDTPTAADLTTPSFDPGRLDFDQTYYWRVDEVNGTPDATVFRSNIWGFTVEPYSIQIPGANMAVTASSTSNEFSLPVTTIDGSGLDSNTNTHSMSSETMWFTAAVDLDPWIQYEFDDVQKLDTMKVWNSNSAAESAIGWSVKDVEIQYSADGETWSVLEGPIQLNPGSGSPTYNQYTTVAFDGAAAKIVRLNIQSNWGGVLMAYGLSEVQFNSIPVKARTPNAASGSVNVLPNADISWRAGREADQHIVYISTDESAVIDGSAPSVTSSTNSVDLGTLDTQLGETYYWRVDEVNDAESPSVWEGPVWSLTTADSIAVDNFENYRNNSPSRPFQTWLDGYGYSSDEFFPIEYPGNGTGAGIGHDIWSVSSPHFDGQIMESGETIPGSNQSMPFYYTNSGGTVAQTDRTWAAPQDWTVGGAKTLVVNFFGGEGNTAGPLFIEINGQKLTYPDNGRLGLALWHQWNIDLDSLGVDLNAITSASIGIDGAGSGMILIDDLRLYRHAPEVSSLITYGFGDLPDAGEAADGVHGGIDFGAGAWWGGDSWYGTSKCGYFAEDFISTDMSFTLPANAHLVSIVVSAESAYSYTIKDSVNADIVGTTGTTPEIIATGWTSGGSTITINSEGGWNVVFDDITYTISQ